MANVAIKLHILIASTRPGRKGPAVAYWLHECLRADTRFTVRIIDLAEQDLPLFDEPHHPMLQNYVHPHTQRWAEIVAEADSYIIVTPEYNQGTTPALINALTYLYHEWNYKPVAYVSYGGGAGGVRAVQALKPIANTLRMVPILESVAISMIANRIDADEPFGATKAEEQMVVAMLDELHRWAMPLRAMRTG